MLESSSIRELSSVHISNNACADTLVQLAGKNILLEELFSHRQYTSPLHDVREDGK